MSPDPDAPKSAARSGPTEAAPARPAWHVALVRPETMTLVLLVLAFIVASLLSPFFLDAVYILDSFTYYAEFALVALVMTLLIISGEIDLSAASMMSLTSCLFAVAFQAGVPMPVAIALSLASGVLLGAFNGLLVIGLQLPSIIVTIGTLIMYRGFAQVIAGDKSIAKFPEWFVGINYRDLLGIPVPIVVFTVAALALALLLGTTIIGRQIYQIGTNEIAARHAGIRTRRIKLLLFVMMGFTSALAGLMTASRLASVRYDLGLGGELQMVLMAMLGGTYIFGGRGSILGTFLAAWLLVIIATGMTVANIQANVQLTVMGTLLIVSIIATNVIYSRTQR